MKKFLTTAIFVCAVCVPVAARGEESPIVVPVKKDEPAPYTGILLNAQAAASIMSDKRVQQDIIKSEVDKAVGLSSAQLMLRLKENDTACREKMAMSEAELKMRDAAVKALEAELKRAQDSAKWTPVWISAGVAGGIAATIMGGIVYSSVKK